MINLTNTAGTASVVVMHQLNLYDAKTQLSALVDRAAAGAEIIIARGGRPMAKLVPYRAPANRKPGSGRRKIWMAADFNAPLPADVLVGFEGGGRGR